jgi:hypothetical protein
MSGQQGVETVVKSVTQIFYDEERIGVTYQPALFLMLGLAFLFLLSVHFSWELSRLEDRVRALAEEVALLRQDAEADDEAPLGRTGR